MLESVCMIHTKCGAKNLPGRTYGPHKFQRIVTRPWSPILPTKCIECLLGAILGRTALVVENRKVIYRFEAITCTHKFSAHFRAFFVMRRNRRNLRYFLGFRSAGPTYNVRKQLSKYLAGTTWKHLANMIDGHTRKLLSRDRERRRFWSFPPAVTKRVQFTFTAGCF